LRRPGRVRPPDGRHRGLLRVNKEQLAFSPDEHGGLVARRGARRHRPRAGGPPNDRRWTAPSSAPLVRSPGVGAPGLQEPRPSSSWRSRAAAIFDRLRRHRVLGERRTASLVDGRGPDAGRAGASYAASDEKEAPGLRFVRLPTLRDRQHLPHRESASGNNGPGSEYFCVEGAAFLGVTPQESSTTSSPPTRSRRSTSSAPRTPEERPVLQALPRMGRGPSSCCSKMGVRASSRPSPVRP